MDLDTENLLLITALFVAVAAYKSIRNRFDISVVSVPTPENSAWTRLWEFGDDS